MVLMYASHILFGRPWKFDRKVKHYRFKNRYSFKKDRRTYIFASLSSRRVYEDQLKLKKKTETEMVIRQCEVMVTMQKHV